MLKGRLLCWGMFDTDTFVPGRWQVTGRQVTCTSRWFKEGKTKCFKLLFGLFTHVYMRLTTPIAAFQALIPRCLLLNCWAHLNYFMRNIQEKEREWDDQGWLGLLTIWGEFSVALFFPAAVVKKRRKKSYDFLTCDVHNFF